MLFEARENGLSSSVVMSWRSELLQKRRFANDESCRGPEIDRHVSR